VDTRPSLSVDVDRLLARLHALEQVSDGGPGVTRLAYSPLDSLGRELVGGWMRAAGLQVHIDQATNVVGRLPGRAGCERVLATGSHLDTVVHGGWLDGAYGVVAAIEVAAAANGAAALDHPLTVVAFANEEGGRGTPGLTGSSAIARGAGTVDLSSLDDEGVSLADRLRSSGGDPDRLDLARWAEESVVAFVELHVEQGPILDRSGRRVGAVEAITGQRQFEVDVVGETNHAGTTPMAGRRDAVVAAAEVVIAVERLTGEAGVRVATVGRMVAEPNVRNVVSGRVHLAVDLRDADRDRMDAATAELERETQRIAVSRDVRISVRGHHSVAPTHCDPVVRAAVIDAAGGLGLSWQPIVSGASHDAQSMAALGPVGMIFVPSMGGVSHAPIENTSPDDLVAGADVLLAALLELDASALCHHDAGIRP